MIRNKVHTMRSKLLLRLLLVATFAFCLGDPTYSRTAQILPCHTLLTNARDCNNLHGPVRTVELWNSGNPATHTFLTYSEDGLLIEQESRRNGLLESRDRYEKSDAGATIVEENRSTENGQAHRTEDVTSLNRQGNVTSRTTRLDDGPLTLTDQWGLDSAGREVSALSCPPDGKQCETMRTDSEHDEQGRLTLTSVIELPSGRVVSRTEYAYPAANRERELDFNACDRDPKAPASLPAYVIETTYDSAGRAVEETTSSPFQTWEEENTPPGGLMTLLCSEGPQLGHVVSHYDDQGHIVDQTFETDGLTGGVTHRHTSHSYDRFGNEISVHVVETRPHCGKTECGSPETTDEREEFVYKYDRFGNWTSKTSYPVDSNGRRGKRESAAHQKLTYYAQ